MTVGPSHTTSSGYVQQQSLLNPCAHPYVSRHPAQRVSQQAHSRVASLPINLPPPRVNRPLASYTWSPVPHPHMSIQNIATSPSSPLNALGVEKKTDSPTYMNAIFKRREKLDCVFGYLWPFLLEQKKIYLGNIENFINAMPKGGSLHNHLSGSFEPGKVCKWAKKAGLWFDPTLKVFVKDDGKGNEGKFSPETYGSLVGTEYSTIEALLSCTDQNRSRAKIEAHFFKRCFYVIDSALEPHVPLVKQVGTFLKKALLQKECYTEMMHEGPVAFPKELEFQTAFLETEIKKHLKAPTAQIPLPPALKELLQQLFNLMWPYVQKSEQLQERLKVYNDCDTQCGAYLVKKGEPYVPVSSADSPVTLRILREIDRTEPSLIRFFWGVLCAHEMARQNKLILGPTPVASENDAYAQTNFKVQMVMLRFLNEHFKNRCSTNHAGEFSPEPNSAAWDRIQDTIALTDCRRISHGLALAKNRNMNGMLKEMADSGRAIESAFTSNQLLSGCGEDNHPFPAYYTAGVPIIPVCDDPGVFGTYLAREWMIAYQRYGLSYRLSYGLSYRDLVEFARNSLHYSFLQRKEKEGGVVEPKEEIKGCATIYEKKKCPANERSYWQVKKEFESLVYERTSDGAYRDPKGDGRVSDSPIALKMIAYERSLVEYESSTTAGDHNDVWMGSIQKLDAGLVELFCRYVKDKKAKAYQHLVQLIAKDALQQMISDDNLYQKTAWHMALKNSSYEQEELKKEQRYAQDRSLEKHPPVLYLQMDYNYSQHCVVHPPGPPNGAYANGNYHPHSYPYLQDRLGNYYPEHQRR